MRAIWSGYISFGLVNIPVKVYSAVGPSKIQFDLLHRKDVSPIGYKKYCKLENIDVPSDEIARGYEYVKNYYVILDDADFLAADIKRSRSIEITDFADEEKIANIYFDRPYYLEPDPAGAHAYVLLRDALKDSHKAGVAKFALHGREHLAVLKPYKNMLMLLQLRFAEEIRPADELNIPQTAAEPKELELAKQIIGQQAESFEITNYKDTYSEKLLKIIDEKSKGRKPAAKIEPIQATEINDLMAMLKESLAKEQR